MKFNESDEYTEYQKKLFSWWKEKQLADENEISSKYVFDDHTFPFKPKKIETKFANIFTSQNLVIYDEKEVNKYIKTHKIEAIINLLDYDSYTDSDFNVKVYHFPIRDYGVPPKEAFIGFVNNIAENYIKKGKNILVHCEAGHGRTGMFITALLKTTYPHYPIEKIITTVRKLDKYIDNAQQMEKITSWFSK